MFSRRGGQDGTIHWFIPFSAVLVLLTCEGGSEDHSPASRRRGNLPGTEIIFTDNSPEAQSN